MSQHNEKKLNRRQALKQGLAGAAGLTGASLLNGSFTAGAQTRNRPNVIIFHTDDQNFDTIGCYGANVLTPHQDSIAGEGVRFTRGYTTTAVCVASRYGCMTGQFPSRCPHPIFTSAYPEGVQQEPTFNTPLKPDAPNIANVFKQAGYKTGMVGKWHLGRSFGMDAEERGLKPLPVDRGLISTWDRNRSKIDPGDPKISKILEHNHNIFRKEIKECGFDYAESFYWTNPEGFNDWTLNIHNMEWIAQGGLDFINQNKDKPFFLYMNTTLHHIPHPQVSLLKSDPRITVGGYLDRAPDCMPPRSEVIKRVTSRGYAPQTAYCTWLDDAVGVVLNRLKELNLAENTLIIFFSDHGTPAKGTLYEGGVNAPCLMRWTNEIPPGQVCNGLAQNLDFAPTIFDACSITKPSDMLIDGKSLLPMVTGKKKAVRDELFFEIGWTRAVCTLQWKYLALRYSKFAKEREKNRGRPNYHAVSLEPHQHNVLLWHPAFWEADQLYDLDVDPNEVVNLAYDPDCADVLNDMKGRMKDWLATFGNHPFGEFVG